MKPLGLQPRFTGVDIQLWRHPPNDTPSAANKPYSLEFTIVPDTDTFFKKAHRHLPDITLPGFHGVRYGNNIRPNPIADRLTNMDPLNKAVLYTHPVTVGEETFKEECRQLINTPALMPEQDRIAALQLLKNAPKPSATSLAIKNSSSSGRHNQTVPAGVQFTFSLPITDTPAIPNPFERAGHSEP